MDRSVATSLPERHSGREHRVNEGVIVGGARLHLTRHASGGNGALGESDSHSDCPRNARRRAIAARPSGRHQCPVEFARVCQTQFRTRGLHIPYTQYMIRYSVFQVNRRPPLCITN